jgi:polysaccharide transporter, PST family
VMKDSQSHRTGGLLSARTAHWNQWHRLRTIFTHSVTQNALALYGIQFAGYIVPLVTLPYLARVLRPEGFGLLLFAQSFALWASLTIEYGFNLSATRGIAQNRGNQDLLARTAGGVLGAKLLLLAVLSMVALTAAWSVESFRQHPAYLLCALLQTLAFGFSPFWYFQGSERMVPAVVVDLLSRTGATGFIFLLVSKPQDGWRVLALQAMAGWITLAIQTLWMYREIGFSWPRWGDSIRALRAGWDMFIFRGAYHIYGTANAFILGLFASSIQAVGYFGGAERMARALQGLTTPFTQALYPHMSQVMAESRHQAARIARWTVALTCGTGLVCALLIAFLGRWFVAIILGPAYGPSVSVLYVLALVLPINSINSALIMQWMLPLGMEKVVGKITMGAIGINLIAAGLLAPGLGHIGMAWAILIAETCKVVALTSVLLRQGLSPLGSFAKTTPQIAEF